MLCNGISATREDIEEIFADFDHSNMGKVSLDRFEEEILPHENIKLKK